MRTRIFKNGNSLAVRLPVELALPEGEVEIVRRGNEIIIRPIETDLLSAWEALCGLSEDFSIEPRPGPEELQDVSFD